MTTPSLFSDRLHVLDELRSIAGDLDRLEQQYGPHEELDDTRRRVEAVRARVLEGLSRAWPPPQ